MKNVIDPKGKVADLLTSLKLQELGFAVQTEKAWVRNNKYEMKQPYRLVSHLGSYMDLRGDAIVTFINSKGKEEWQYKDGLEIVPAPDFAEIWKELPKSLYLDNGIINNGSVDRQIVTLELVAMQQIHYANLKGFVYSFIIQNNNLAQAAAELYLKLKTENLL